MSVDGKTAPANRKGRLFVPFMGEELSRRLHRLRSEVDAVLVGVGTTIEDNPRLTVRFVKGKNPIRVVLDSKARVPMDAAVHNVKEAPTIVVISEAAAANRVEALRRRGVEVKRCGSLQVDVRRLLEELYERGVRRILVEGGGEVRWSLFKERLVDELFVWVMPAVWGGRDAPTLVDGLGFTSAGEAVGLKLSVVEKVGDVVVLKYFTHF